MLSPALFAIFSLFTLAILFNPYGAQRWRTTLERWTARDRSHGWPYYWTFKNQCPKDRSGMIEAKAYNRHRRHSRVCSNIIYLE